MNIYYLDPSAWTKRYTSERGSDRIDNLFAQRPRAVTSTLGVIEMLASLARARGAGRLTDAAYREAASDVRERLREMESVELSGPVVEIAKMMADRYALRASDTVHLASAEYVRKAIADDGDEVLMVSADDELNAAARMAGFQVLNPVRA